MLEVNLTAAEVSALSEQVARDMKLMLSETDVSKMEGILAVGDFIESSLPGSDIVEDRLHTYLKLRGHVNINFPDVYAALNVLEQEDLQMLVNLAVQNGMPDPLRK